MDQIWGIRLLLLDILKGDFTHLAGTPNVPEYQLVEVRVEVDVAWVYAQHHQFVLPQLQQASYENVYELLPLSLHKLSLANYRPEFNWVMLHT